MRDLIKIAAAGTVMAAYALLAPSLVEAGLARRDADQKRPAGHHELPRNQRSVVDPGTHRNHATPAFVLGLGVAVLLNALLT
jgi:hypothetical protein